jgi:hypothetical protein
VPLLHGVKYKKNKEVYLYLFNHPPCARKLPKLVPLLRKEKILKIGKIGIAYSILAPANALLKEMAEMLKADPTLNLCDGFYCLWCREFERRMNLYRKIKKPKFFQKNILVIKLISLINKYRLKEYQYLSFKRNREKKIKRFRFSKIRFLISELRRSIRILYLVIYEILH